MLFSMLTENKVVEGWSYTVDLFRNPKQPPGMYDETRRKEW